MEFLSIAESRLHDLAISSTELTINSIIIKESEIIMEEKKVIYFSEEGPVNTGAALELAASRAKQGGISKALVATTSGRTGILAIERLEGVKVVAVSHSFGFKEANKSELKPSYREKILASGAELLTATHVFGGIGRSIRRKFGTYEIEEIIAQTLRCFGQGTKVGIEIALMAADAGLAASGESVLTIAGSDKGADTVLVVKTANTQNFFDLKVQEIVCKPLN